MHSIVLNSRFCFDDDFQSCWFAQAYHFDNVMVFRWRFAWDQMSVPHSATSAVSGPTFDELWSSAGCQIGTEDPSGTAESGCET